MNYKETNEIMAPADAMIVDEILTHIKNEILVEYSALLTYLENIHTIQNNNDGKNTYLLRMLEGCNLVNLTIQGKNKNYTLSIEGYIAQSKGIIKYSQDISLARRIEINANISTFWINIYLITSGILGFIIGLLI